MDTAAQGGALWAGDSYNALANSSIAPAVMQVTNSTFFSNGAAYHPAVYSLSLETTSLIVALTRTMQAYMAPAQLGPMVALCV